MSLSKKTQEKIDALKNGVPIEEKPIIIEELIETGTKGHIETDLEYAERVSGIEVIPEGTPIENLTPDDIPLIEVESLDTTLEEELTYIFEPLTLAKYREIGILYENTQSISSDKPEEMLDRLVCPQIMKDSIMEYIREFSPSYMYVYFNEETYSQEPINNFVIAGKAEYSSPPVILGEVNNTIDRNSEIEMFQNALSYELSERISKLQFYQKNIKETFKQYLDGNPSVKAKELEIKMHTHFDFKK
jgi:hypothetical protein